MRDIESLEREREMLQSTLDSQKDRAERNRLGQFATPPALAQDILAYAKTFIGPTDKVRFLDPAFGTGSFYSALLRVFGKSRVAKAAGYEIDSAYAEAAKRIWRDTGLKIHIDDFTSVRPPEIQDKRATLLICNPPYVRHHHISQGDKARLLVLSARNAGVKLNGLAGLYCHFLCISHRWLADHGLAGWLIPSEFMDVNYGGSVKRYLTQKVTLQRVHRFDPNDVQFGDALVSSVVIWFRNEAPVKGHKVECTFGGSLLKPRKRQMIDVAELSPDCKWTQFPLSQLSPTSDRGIQLKELFEIKRGVATGSNEFFIVTESEASKHGIPNRFMLPMLPSARQLAADEIRADSSGLPLITPRLFLLSCDLPEEEVRTHYPELWAYLQQGRDNGLDRRYLCSSRSPWYAQERRPVAPLLCTYMGRNGKTNKPFRFILNASKAIAANTYLLLYPRPALQQVLRGKPELLRTLWEALNNISVDQLTGAGRVYGGGLHKLEPRELGNVSLAGEVAEELKAAVSSAGEQRSLFEYYQS